MDEINVWINDNEVDPSEYVKYLVMQNVEYDRLNKLLYEENRLLFEQSIKLNQKIIL